MSASASEFAAAYARHRAKEGRGLDGDALRALPYLREGPLARQWEVRARTFDAFLQRVVGPMSAGIKRPLRILDLGAGNGWLSHRLCGLGHDCTAVDIRDDAVDGLGSAAALARDWPGRFACVTASFETLPLEPGQFDITLFNASLHYAQDLGRVLREAMRVTRTAGTLAVMDSPFYRRDQDGRAMVVEKRASGRKQFGDDAGILLAGDFIEYLTPDRLNAAVETLSWAHHRVRYPLWYELRPLMARLKRARMPSRFDLWTAQVP